MRNHEKGNNGHKGRYPQDTGTQYRHRELVRSLKETSIECLTLYAFSSENWKRPEL